MWQLRERSIPAKTAYKTTNWHDYNQALRQRKLLTVQFDPNNGLGGCPDRQARPPTDVQGCGHSGSLRQTTGFVASLLKLAGLDWFAPDFSTLSRRQETLNVAIPYRGSKGPLHLLVDNAGIKVGRVEVSGMRASMAVQNGGFGVKSISESMKKPWKSVPSKRPPAMSEMREFQSRIQNELRLFTPLRGLLQGV